MKFDKSTLSINQITGEIYRSFLFFTFAICYLVGFIALAITNSKVPRKYREVKLLP